MSQAVTLAEFAKNNGLLKSQALSLAMRGRIAGSYQLLDGHRWYVYPPAALFSPLKKIKTWRDRLEGEQP